MEERLVVKNFGPIKDVDIRIGKLTVLIGEQATGKSTLSKLLHLFADRGFLFDPENNFINVSKAQIPLDKETEILYTSSNFIIKYSNEKFLVSTRGVNAMKLARFGELYRKIFSGLSSVEKDEFSKLDNWYLENVGISTFVPAERIYANDLNDTQTLLNSSPLIRDYFISLNSHRNKTKDLIIPHLNSVKYSYINGREVVQVEDKSIPLAHTSSGFQTSIPIVVLLNGYAQTSFRDSIIIEEPELNLFPTTQLRLMQYLVSNLNKTENQILITTHSPYALAALNNMLNAYRSGQIDKARTEAILPADYWLNADEVTAYRLMPDGTAKNLMDDEFGMIDSDEIDEVSGTLNQQFNDLVNIQLEVENE